MSRLILISLLLAALPGLADTVYKSVDSAGNVSYSDQPPTDAVELEVMEFREPAPTRSAEDAARLAEMRETTDRMAADRREREQARAQARREAQPAPVYQEYYPVVLHRRGYYDYQRPHHPILRPPQAYRPIAPGQYPAKLVRQHYTGKAAEVFNPSPGYPARR